MSWRHQLLRGFRQPPHQFFDTSKRVRRWHWWSPITRRGPRSTNNTARFNHTNTLKAGAAGGAVILALAHKPLSTSLPFDIQEKIEIAWDAAYKLDSLVKTREAAWQTTRVWLSHYFRGSFMDEGPLGTDMVIARGLYILAADTRLFFLPPENRYTTPTVCLAVNYAWRASLENSSYMTTEELDQDDSKWYASLIEDRVLYELQDRLDRWGTQGKFDRFFVVVRFQDATAYYTYDDEGWEMIDGSDMLTEDDVVIHQ